MIELYEVAWNLIFAVVCGSVIGLERQARHRTAGVRTNALVALGAASFLSFSALFPGDAAQTRVAAQIVSGIGFLGAGLIFRDGMSVHGLNTAATLWCAAAVGMMAGADAPAMAGLLTLIVMAVNLGLRPLVNLLDRALLKGAPQQRNFRLVLAGTAGHEAEMRASLMRTVQQVDLRLVSLDVRTPEDGEVELVAHLGGGPGADAAIDRAVSILVLESGQRRVGWAVADEG